MQKMGRLSDADALIEAFKVKSGIWTETSKYLIGVIEKQPTAYSVEKVVAELEKDERHTFDGCSNKRYAVDLVRKGGAT